MIRELQLYSEALWESIKIDILFFAPIKIYAKRLSELNYSEPQDVQDALLLIEKIDEFFGTYTNKQGMYVVPKEIDKNRSNLKNLKRIAHGLKNSTASQIQEMLDENQPIKKGPSVKGNKIFIGHGRNKLWARLQVFLQDDLNIESHTFESESRTSEGIINILEGFLDDSAFAILILTAEDETAEGKVRARQNVVHEAGLFQGRLGFNRVVILKQKGVEEFTNIAGLQYIPFSADNIEECFYELQRTLKKMGLLN